ncbi:MAG: DegT/DnrJ/EryC1/StrS family aminotransferase [Solirubrobacterales bacterium]
MEWRLPLADVHLSEPVIAASMEALRSNWLTMGPRTQDLEREFAARVGAEHAVAASSGSAAIHLAMLGIGIGPGDEVIVPACGFVADAHAPFWCGGETVFADVESVERPVIDPEAVAGLITERTKAVLAIHMFGYSCDMETLTAICAERDVLLIEDCCQAVGAELPGGKSVGTSSAAGCFSFFAKTQLPVGEGGIIVTDDEEVAARARLLRSHAMTSVTWDRHRGHAETYDITDLGFNYRLDEPRAAMARAHLDALDEKLARLRATVARYRERLADLDGVTVPFTDEEVGRGGHFAFPVVVGDRVERDRIRARLTERGIQTTFYPVITDLAVYERAGREHPCPHAVDFSARHMAMPLATVMTPEDVDLAVGELAAALQA